MTKQQLDDKETFDGFSLGDLINFGNYFLAVFDREITDEDVESWKQAQIKSDSRCACADIPPVKEYTKEDCCH